MDENSNPFDEPTSAESLPWPETEDVLFKGDDDWWHNACLDPFTVDWHKYALGYLKAGDVLCRYAMRHRAELDFLIYPIVFNYRQFLELMIKGLILDCRALLRTSGEKIDGHNIESKWQDCRKLLEAIFPDDPSETLDIVEANIKEFHEMDRSSFTYRYPVDKQGEQSLPSKLRLLNVRQLHGRMEQIANFLICVADAVGAYSEAKADMESEWRQDMLDEYDVEPY